MISLLKNQVNGKFSRTSLKVKTTGKIKTWNKYNKGLAFLQADSENNNSIMLMDA